MTEDELRDTLDVLAGDTTIAERPESKTSFNVNGKTVDAAATTEAKIVVDLENGDTIDGF